MIRIVSQSAGGVGRCNRSSVASRRTSAPLRSFRFAHPWARFTLPRTTSRASRSVAPGTRALDGTTPARRATPSTKHGARTWVHDAHDSLVLAPKNETTTRPRTIRPEERTVHARTHRRQRNGPIVRQQAPFTPRLGMHRGHENQEPTPASRRHDERLYARAWYPLDERRLPRRQNTTSRTR